MARGIRKFARAKTATRAKSTCSDVWMQGVLKIKSTNRLLISRGKNVIDANHEFVKRIHSKYGMLNNKFQTKTEKLNGFYPVCFNLGITSKDYSKGRNKK